LALARRELLETIGHRTLLPVEILDPCTKPCVDLLLHLCELIEKLRACGGGAFLRNPAAFLCEPPLLLREK
jgi:hypothetical protein